MADPLADGPEDEKDIARSEKEAWIGLERAQAKKDYGRGGGGKGKQKRMRQMKHRYEPYADYGRRERYVPQATLAPPPIPQRNCSRLQMLGHCSAYGYLQPTCTATPRWYPLLQHHVHMVNMLIVVLSVLIQIKEICIWVPLCTVEVLTLWIIPTGVQGQP